MASGTNSTHRLTAAACAAVVPLALVACSEQRAPTVDEPAPAPTVSSGPPRLALPTEPDLLVVAGPEGEPVQRGTAELETEISSLDGGVVRPAAGGMSRGAWRFPSYRSGDPYPRAVVVARPAAAGDDEVGPLSPGTRRFDYGADLRLDTISTGRVEDNGNNVVQRGLSSDPSMFKLEIDADGRPGCIVKGRSGEVRAFSVQPLNAGTWYRIRCERRARVLRVLVSEYLPSGRALTEVRELPGRAGAVTFPGSEVPFSIGGKAAHDGSVITSATDQFNGAIDNAYFTMP